MTGRTETLYQIIDRCRLEARDRDEAVALIYNEVTGGDRLGAAMADLVKTGINVQLDDVVAMDLEREREAVTAAQSAAVKAAASMMNVSESAVYQAKRVLDSGRQDLVDAVMRGEMTIHTALRRIDGDGLSITRDDP
jgi:hypothetical protein